MRPSPDHPCPAGLRLVLIAFSALTLLAAPAPAAAQPQLPRPMGWKPVSPEELALASPRVDPQADAEALLWDVRVYDQVSGQDRDTPQTVFENYLRVKIFTERGKDAHATVDLPYVSSIRVTDVAARTIRPDGSIVELKRSDVFTRTVVKANDLKVKAVSFALPAIAVGAIIEYRWRETHDDSLSMNLLLPFSREIPVHLVRYSIRPLPEAEDFRLLLHAFNGNFSPLEPQRDGFSMTSLTNVRARRDEPYPSPALDHQPWLFLTYSQHRSETVGAYWTRMSTLLFDLYAERAKGSDELRRAALEATSGATDPRAQVAALVRAAQARVARVDLMATPIEMARAAKPNKTAGEAFKRGQGTADDLIVVLMAMAKAVGLDARVVATPDRSEMFYKFDSRLLYMARDRIVAIRVADDWIFAEPANELSKTGALRWYQEWQPVMITDPKAPIFTRTPVTPAADSGRRRTATLKLLEDGTLQGDVEVTFAGHYDQRLKRQEMPESDDERAASLREAYAKRLPGAELTDIRIEHVTDAEKPYTTRFTIRIPGYAQKTGSRLFLQPAVFQKGLDPVFPSETREQDVYFPFGWTEKDTISIAIPDDYEIEAPTRPAPIASTAGRHQIALNSTDSWRTLQVKRTFVVGLSDALLVKHETYAALKQFFDLVQQKDAHTIALRKKVSTP